LDEERQISCFILSKLREEVKRGLGDSKTSKAHLNPQPDNNVEFYVMMIEGPLSQHTNGTEIRAHTFSCWPTEHRPNSPQA